MARMSTFKVKIFMETGSTNNEGLEGLLDEQQKRIAALERAFAEAEHRAQKHLQERDHWHSQHWEAHQENRRLQQDYESLRLQKGGFGFRMLLTVGFSAALFGLVSCYLFFRLKNDETKTFQHFTHEHQFRFEYALSHGQFEEVEAALRSSAEQPEFQAVRPEIEFTKKIVEAAKRGCK